MNQRRKEPCSVRSDATQHLCNAWDCSTKDVRTHDRDETYGCSPRRRAHGSPSPPRSRRLAGESGLITVPEEAGQYQLRRIRWKKHRSTAGCTITARRDAPPAGNPKMSCPCLCQRRLIHLLAALLWLWPGCPTAGPGRYFGACWTRSSPPGSVRGAVSADAVRSCCVTELGPQPLRIHVETPKRGRIHICKANHRAMMPTMTKISILEDPSFEFIDRPTSLNPRPPQSVSRPRGWF